MKVYTKKGDKGETGLIGGTRVSKAHVRIEAYGTVDELNSYTGLLRDTAVDDLRKDQLIEIQDRLFTLGSWLANDEEKSKMKLPELMESDVDYLEKAIDEMEESLEPMKFFVLPGGHVNVSYCHIARCVCRRSERLVVRASEVIPVSDLVISYLNRLSDYLFVYSRYLCAKLEAEEIPWKPRK
ncbi:MAG: cob(I)yrinic acid a,c-diamide adenosyltransferase [Crocinitomicaceae bacterium]|nr:cob(I)yrinic acid a,c-diamide adenosyltransferase [Crocinitomicaceae bacterium]